MRRFLIIIISVALTFARLQLPSEFKQNSNGDSLKAEVNDPVRTSCNVIDITKLGAALPVGQLVYSGYLNINADNKSGLGYIFYGSQKATKSSDLSKYPTIIWLNGGPGSSSQLGNFLELGPIWIGADNQKTLNKNSWNTLYNLMIVDQPVGVGYGYAETIDVIPVNQDQVGQQFLYAWNEFLVAPTGCVVSQSLSGLLKSSWFVFGESYAGKYVPAIAEAVLKGGKIPLRGIGIGDGFTDPSVVMSEMPNFGYSYGLSDFQERKTNEANALGGMLNIRNQQWLAAQQSFDDTCGGIVTQSGEVNVYNIFIMGNYDSLEKPVEAYLNSTETKTLFGFNPNRKYSLSNDDVYKALSEDFMKSDCVARVEYVLTQIPVLIYNGNYDLIVPTPATSRWVYALKHSNSVTFKKTDFAPWILNDNVVGYKKSAGNLEYRTVNKAGHLVPMDQPESALDMVKSFVESHK